MSVNQKPNAVKKYSMVITPYVRINRKKHIIYPLMTIHPAWTTLVQLLEQSRNVPFRAI